MLWQCFKIFDVCCRFALNHMLGRLYSAPPEPIAEFMGAYFWLNASLSPTKITPISHLGKLTGTVTTTA